MPIEYFMTGKHFGIRSLKDYMSTHKSMQNSLRWKLGEKLSPIILIIGLIYVDSTPSCKDQFLLYALRILTVQFAQGKAASAIKS